MRRNHGYEMGPTATEQIKNSLQATVLACNPHPDMEKKAKKGGKGRSGEKRGRKRKSEKTKVNENEDQYLHWKADIPLVYDWFTHHNLAWPSLSCRWGPQLEQAKYTNCNRLYFSEQTDGSSPNTLVISNCQVVKRRVAFAEHISQFDEEADSPFVKKLKTIIHPGEVNRIRELPQNSKIVATHTDSPDVLVWDVDLQPNRVASAGAVDSVPDLILTGHKEKAEFALAMCRTEPFVLSGGKDRSVVSWSIDDHLSSLVEASKSSGTPSVGPRGVYQGHRDTIEDVQFLPSSAQEFCSVGDDSCLILWDARVGRTPIIKVEKAHNADLHCVDWNRHDENLILTGSADNTVRLFDRRKLILDGVGSPIHNFEGHEASVLCVQWCPEKASVFGSSAEDGLLNIWDLEKVGKKAEIAGTTLPPPGLFFAHAGHRNNKVVDFHWSTSEPWVVVSVSNDVESSGGGGSLQIWRMLDFLYRPEEEIMAELEKFQSHVRTCEG